MVSLTCSRYHCGAPATITRLNRKGGSEEKYRHRCAVLSLVLIAMVFHSSCVRIVTAYTLKNPSSSFARRTASIWRNRRPRLTFRRSNGRGGNPSSSSSSINPLSTTSIVDNNSKQLRYRNDDGGFDNQSIFSKKKDSNIYKLLPPFFSGSRKYTIAKNLLEQPLLTTVSSSSKKKRIVRTVQDLRTAILDEQLSLSDTIIMDDDTDSSKVERVIAGVSKASNKPTSVPTDFFDNHAVRNLMKERYDRRSTPGNRHQNDNATLALSIEGGGMRGCVSAGMVAAIASLGLSDTIDKVYGSSAGSVVGSYLVSRQVCMDVYVDILPAAKKLFVCKKRMFKNLASSLVDILVRSSIGKKDSTTASTTSFQDQVRNSPGMNISFVLDGIMGQDHGIRPLDLQTFRQNNAKQPLRVVSSCIDPETGRLFSKCFGTEDFFNETAVVKADGSRRGLFACLEASMTVPGATGPPVNILRGGNEESSSAVLPCFDAFCFEPIPYRSAVEEGATHVLVLSSRPEEYKIKTRPGIYEIGVAPMYFHSHGHKEVAEFFEQGGQQYLYAEDLLTFEEAKMKKVYTSDDEEDQRVLIPPPEIIYGVPRNAESSYTNREETWKRAHLMPLRVPKGHQELPTLEQDKDSVLEAVRGGFETAFDSLSSIVGLNHIKGSDAARLVFPDDEDESPAEEILGSVLEVPGEEIEGSSVDTIRKIPIFVRRLDGRFRERRSVIFRRFRRGSRINSNEDETANKLRLVGGASNSNGDICHRTLLELLPGFQQGRFRHLARGLMNGMRNRE